MTRAPDSSARRVDLSRLALLARDPKLRRQLSVYVLSRLPSGMFGLSVLVLVRERLGGFAAAGAVMACFSIAVAVVAPVAGRVVDRVGPRPVLPAMAAGHLAGAIIAAGGESLTRLCVGAAIAGVALPPTPACIRAQWRVLPERTRATVFAVDGVILEAAQVAGPLLIGAILVVGSASTALVAAASCTAVAALLTATMAPPHVRIPGQRHLLGPLRVAAVDLVLATIALITAAIAIVEISVVAFAAARHDAALAGPLFAAMAAGSVVGGVVLATRERRRPARELLAPLCLASAVGFALLLLAGTHTWLLALLLALSNAAVAPAFAVVYAYLSEIAPEGETAETFTWVSSSNFIAISAGTTLGGLLLAHTDRAVAYLVAVAVLILSAATADAARRTTQIHT